MNAIPQQPIIAGASTAQSASRSHVGRVRAFNEDRVFDCTAAGLWAVADGMGGHRGGDLAAQAVVDALRLLTQTMSPVTVADVERAMQRANADILQRNHEQGLDAGATLVLALSDGAVMHIAWAGDSRAYRVRDGGLDLLTEDHSVVQELVAAGLLSADMAGRHPQANVITRALGVSGDLALDWRTVEVRAGDRFLLCSDGLSRSLDESSITSSDPLEETADALLEHALRRDGTDNISLVVVAP